MQCPMGNSYCHGVMCDHWALMGWCLLSRTSRAVDAEKEALKLKVIALEKETLDQRDESMLLKKQLSDAQLTLKNYRKRNDN